MVRRRIFVLIATILVTVVLLSFLRLANHVGNEQASDNSVRNPLNRFRNANFLHINASSFNIPLKRIVAKFVGNSSSETVESSPVITSALSLKAKGLRHNLDLTSKKKSISARSQDHLTHSSYTSAGNSRIHIYGHHIGGKFNNSNLVIGKILHCYFILLLL